MSSEEMSHTHENETQIERKYVLNGPLNIKLHDTNTQYLIYCTRNCLLSIYSIRHF